MLILLLRLNLRKFKFVDLDTRLDIGGSRGRAGRTPPYGTQFFHFRIHFCQKVPVSGVHAPPNGSTPAPPGNPGSATSVYHFKQIKVLKFIPKMKRESILVLVV